MCTKAHGYRKTCRFLLVSNYVFGSSWESAPKEPLIAQPRHQQFRGRHHRLHPLSSFFIYHYPGYVCLEVLCMSIPDDISALSSFWFYCADSLAKHSSPLPHPHDSGSSNSMWMPYLLQVEYLKPSKVFYVAMNLWWWRDDLSIQRDIFHIRIRLNDYIIWVFGYFGKCVV